MFYLLEDNRIIDSEKTKYFDLYTRVGFLLEIDGETVIKNLGKIKKQSENVIDLIESGDLLKIKYEGRIELCDFQDNEANYANYLKNYYPNDILAIYKPNEEGDYIKVWERK